MITEIKNEIFEKYEIRKSKKQKTAFIEYIKGICEQNGIPCTVEKKSGNRNIVMGSVDDCEIVVGGHYDTCAVMPFPNFITPNNFFLYVVYQILLCVVIYIPPAAVGIAVSHFFDSQLGFYSFFVLVWLELIIMMYGPANKHTANDNTSGVITVLNTMLSMTPEQRAGVCFVLFDNEEMGLKGSSAFNSMHKKVMKDKIMINADCVSDGDYLMVKPAKRDRKTDTAKKIYSIFEKQSSQYGMTVVDGTKCFYPSDQANFKRGYGLAAFRKSKLIGLYLGRIHTKRDTVFIERNIEFITAGLIEYVSGNAEETDVAAEQ